MSDTHTRSAKQPTAPSFPIREGLARAVSLLTTGGVVVLPTDTVYGLAVHPAFPHALERLYRIKHREMGKPIAMLASDIDAVKATEALLPPAAEALMSKYWPGALTLVLPLPDGRTEGFRMPAHEPLRELIRQCGGLLRVTSANFSGEPPATDAAMAQNALGSAVDLVLADGVSPGGTASTVVAVAHDGSLRILREGPVRGFQV